MKKLNDDDLQNISGGTGQNTDPELNLGHTDPTTGTERSGGGGAGNNPEDEELPGDGNSNPEYGG